MTQDIESSLPELPPARFGDDTLRQCVQAALDAKTKPRGSLGRLESLALQLALIQRTERPRLVEPQLVVFAADHGIAAQGVSAYPPEVTRQMVLNFLAGGAAVSVLSRQHGLALTVADCGVAAEFDPHPVLARLKVPGVEQGTADSSQGPAMTATQCAAAIATGAGLWLACPATCCCWARWASATPPRRRC
ncbi:Nicotinate-nucleotide--dimethylbenzimidazole phosphoribosyltransferase [Methylibium sp. T29]|nr:Nicotinate-nucleotide--dimethylbenzimidazole phosphoribosyltransferase [Methylibium sp. T29]